MQHRLTNFWAELPATRVTDGALDLVTARRGHVAVVPHLA
jgi:hypothetical protein